ncbi:MAG: hypothetical protein ACT4TC_19190 [Myxococcaceae bacterium]
MSLPFFKKVVGSPGVRCEQAAARAKRQQTYRARAAGNLAAARRALNEAIRPDKMEDAKRNFVPNNPVGNTIELGRLSDGLDLIVRPVEASVQVGRAAFNGLRSLF